MLHIYSIALVAACIVQKTVTHSAFDTQNRLGIDILELSVFCHNVKPEKFSRCKPFKYVSQRRCR